MATCNRLYYVSKVCLRLLRKYTNEIYPNEVPKADKLQPKKQPSESDDKNEGQLCKLSLVHFGMAQFSNQHTLFIRFQMD